MLNNTIYAYGGTKTDGCYRYLGVFVLSLVNTSSWLTGSLLLGEL